MPQVECFNHSRDVPATISQLLASLDRFREWPIKQNPGGKIVIISYARNRS